MNLGAMNDGPYTGNSALQATSQARQKFGTTYVPCAAGGAARKCDSGGRKR